MKKLITIALLLACASTFAQSTVLFHENFDQPSGPDSVTVSVLSGSNPMVWNDTNSLYSSSGHSFHIKGTTPNSEVVFETPAFSTVGHKVVYLSFNHIAKLYILSQGIVEISVNNGATWANVNQNTNYYGSSVNYTSLGWFCAVNYPVDWDFNSNTGPGSIPDNSWWKSELLELTNLLGNGHSQVKLRFRAKFSTPHTSGFQSGWYVDDLLIVGMACETIKPELVIDTLGICAQSTVLEGPVKSPSSFNETRTFIATDNVGIDSLRLVEILNKNNTRYSSLTSGSQDRYYASYTNYNSFDTIQWRVEAYDTCGNMSSFPDTGYYRFYFDKDLPKCPGGNCNQGHNFINHFPWTQDFESSDWIAGNSILGSSGIRGMFPLQLSYNVLPPVGVISWGWSVNQGPTPSAGTGPMGDHTTGNGKYLYTEFHGLSGQANSGFVLPCIDLTDSIPRMLTFNYHMFGIDIQRLTIRIDSTYGSIENYHAAKNIQGQQHLSETENWTKGYVDLSPYSGRIIKVRIGAAKTASASSYSNIAIDDLAIQNIRSIDIGTTAIISPRIDALACYGTNNLSITVNAVNVGATPVSKVPLAYQVNNDPVVFDTIDLSGKSFGFDTNYTFSAVFNLSPTSAHTIKAWSVLAADTNFNNDTVKLEIPIQQYQAINSFPHRLDFENETAGLGNSSTLSSPHWTLNRSSDSLTYWTVEQGPFLNDFMSPYNAQGRDRKALVIRKGQGNNQSYAEIESQCVDLSGLTAPVLQFMYYGESNLIEIYAKEFGDINWTQISASMPQPASKNPMSGFTLPLSSYAGKVIKVKIKAKNPTLPNGVTVIDNIMIREQPTQDLEIKKVGLARIFEHQTSYPTARVFYTNWAQTGGASYSKILKVEIRDRCNPSTIVYSAQSSPLNSLNTTKNGFETFANVIFPTQVPAGEYSAKIWVESSSDVYADNDTVYQDLVCIKSMELPYVNDFESCDNQTYMYGLYQQWQIGQGKNTLDSVSDGVKCVITNPNGNSFSGFGNYDFLDLPPFSGLDTLYGAKFGFLQSFSFANPNSFGVVEIFDGQQWNQLTNGVYYGTNWRSYISKTIGDVFYSKGFTGNSNGWIHSSYPLAEYNSPGEKIIRFVSHTEGVPGWAIDSIYIDYPEQNSGAPVEFVLQGNVAQAGANMVNLKVKNTASAPLDEIEITVEHNGTVLHNQHAVFNPALAGGQTALVALSQSLQLDSTMSQLLVYTSRPNNRKDEITADDTLIIPIRILGTADSNQSCFDFEHNSDFSPYSTVNGLNNTGWEKGSPQKTIIDSTYAGSSCWFTSENEYDIQQNSYLYTPEFAVNGTYCYRLGFWHQFDFEKNFDGGNVEYTLDGGNEWKVLGHYWSTDTTWYNHQFIQSLDGNKPGWSGNSNGWIYSNFDFNVFWNDTVQFRFRYATDADINYEGWAIDNVCFEPISSNCSSIGMEEQEAVQPEISLYPNPASTEIYLQCGLEGIYEISIYSAKGELVKSWTENLETGKTLKINIEELTPGFYSIGINNSNSSISKRFVKTR